ncbi:bifunctional acetate--CoA ligase family protein/GNAT family N-acetyltransferase [Candidatus Bipolaricaulota bacterium]|nr:bifunctional acetate--CoA ligase family protein/GNAT family N-acetyltransferase [Candidatus Bipolaricaulota bacterium]
MSIKNLEKIFDPNSIAVVGASEKEGSVGADLMDNIVGNYQGEVYPVNPNRKSVMGINAFPSVTEIGKKVDLGVIATPAPTVPGIVKEMGETGIKAAVVITAGFSEADEEGSKLEEELKRVSRKYGVRIVGPNCIGVIRPSSNLSASFLRKQPREGSVAFISQSGAMGSGILDWAKEAHVGFSSFVSVGNMIDVDFADLIDYFGQDPDTESIIMYMEAVSDAERFMSAASSFARKKPIIVTKSGRYSKSAEAVASHTGSLAGEDTVYNAAFKRTGVTRVGEVSDVFSCSEVLAKQDLPAGSNIGIITNAGGPGIMATDAIYDWGCELAELDQNTVEELKEALPSAASTGNPVDVLGDAGSERYRKAGEICLEDPNVDGLVVLYTPQGGASATDAAKAISQLSEGADKPIVTSWIGGEEVRQGRRVLRQGGVPTRPTPEQAISAYSYMYRHTRNLELLYETPEELSVNGSFSNNDLKKTLEDAVESGRTTLTEVEAKRFLDSYNIPISKTLVAETAEEAVDVASDLGYPVVLKIHSPDITHKTDVGGVELNLRTEEDVRQAYSRIIERAREEKPSAKIEGVSVQKMFQDVDFELLLGSNKDPLFGSVMMFGRGGTGVELYQDTVAGFPPLNQVLAHRMMEDTKIYELLQGYRGDSGADIRELEENLVRFSQMIIDFPEIKEIDINPLAVVDGKLKALDARIIVDSEVVNEGPQDEHKHLAIEPYPRKYSEDWTLEDGRSVTLRPIRPEDEPREFELFDSFSDETWRQRFFGPRYEVTHEDMIQYTNIDYRREMAMVGILEENGEKKMIGVGRLVIGPSKDTGEYAVVVGDPWQGLGLGEKLTESIIDIANDKGLDKIVTKASKAADPMLHLCDKMGFQERSENEDAVEMELELG